MYRQNYPRKLFEERAQRNISLKQVFKLIAKKKRDLTSMVKEGNQPSLTLPFLKNIHIDHQEEHTQKISQDKACETEQSELVLATTAIKNYQRLYQVDRDEYLPDLVSSGFKHIHLPTRAKILSKYDDSKQHSNSNHSQHQEMPRKKAFKTQFDEEESEQIQTTIKVQNIEKAKENFITSIEKVPKSVKFRTEATLTEPIFNLQVFNPFFNRNPRIVNVCLMKIGKIVYKHSALLYSLGQQASHFYIILSGRVKLVNGGFKKICQTGQTVLQEAIYCKKDVKIALEKAKTLGSVYLLQIGIKQFKSMKEEMVKHRFKIEMGEMEAVIKRNYIVKNWQRNKVRAQENF